MIFYEYDGFCLCPWCGEIPLEAVPVERCFDPLVFVAHYPPEDHRGVFRISRLSELDEPETVELLHQHQAEPARSALERFVARHGATVLNTAFANAYDVLQAMQKKAPFRVNLVGLGDVGGTVLLGLKLLGKEISEIGIYDPNTAQCQRYALEMNQILPVTDGQALPPVVVRDADTLFDCDALLFTASLGVPAVGSAVKDVRMAQYARNRDMLAQYARAARESHFTGLFAQISDPVDHLCRAVFLASNRDERGNFDGCGLLPEQIQGYGLGVMHARAEYYAKQLDLPFGAVFGPHGQDLIVANAVDEQYDAVISQRLTQATVAANLDVRALGFKPYIAPGLSSAAISVLRTLRGEWHDGAVPFGGAYFGCRSRMTQQGVQLEQLPLDARLQMRMETVHRTLREFDYDG